MKLATQASAALKSGYTRGRGSAALPPRIVEK